MTSEGCGSRCEAIAVAHDVAQSENGVLFVAQEDRMDSLPDVSRAGARCLAGVVTAALLAGTALFATASRAAEQSYPFEGTWVKADRICSPTAPNTRTYTAHELIVSGGHCSLRKVAFGSGEWELFEECHRPERPGTVTERIRMLGQDAILVKWQVVRLKIARGRRYTRCTIAGPKPAPDKPPATARGAPALPVPPPPKP